MSNGFTDGSGGGFDFGSLFSGLLALLAALINAIIAFLNALVQALIQVFTILFKGLAGIFGFTDAGLGAIFKGLKNLMDQIFKVWVTKQLAHLFDLYSKLTKWVRKLKAWLDRLRRLQQLHMLMAMRRMLNLIHRIRRILILFRILHIGIARKLDHFLAGLEGRLVGRVFALVGKTNAIIRWVNLVADPRGLLHPGGQLAGLGGILQGITSALDALRPGAFNCLPAQAVGPGVAVEPWLKVRERLTTERTNNSGDTAEVSKQFTHLGELFALDMGSSTKLSGGG